MFSQKHYPLQPRVIQIETTTICNGNCWFCAHHKTNRPAVLMSDVVWRKIVDETRGLGITYRPFMLNEPFSDERMVEIVSHIRDDKTAQVEFNTNAELLTPDLSRRLVKCGISVMRFSIDGIRHETIRRTRGLDRDTVYENVLAFLEINSKSFRSAIVEVRMINFPDMDPKEQEEFLDFWRGTVDRVSITKLYQYPWTGQQDCAKKRCPKIREEMFFRFDGFATLCCWDAFGKGLVESVLEKSVLEIWNGTKLREYRNLLDKKNRHLIPLCSRCDAFADL